MTPDFAIRINCNECLNEGSQKITWIGIGEILNQDFSEIQDEDGKCLACGKSNFTVQEWREDMELFNNISPTLESALLIAEILDEIDRKNYDEVAVEAFFTNWELNQFEHFEDAFIGELSLLDYATQLLPELYEIPSKLDMYIDYRKFANDLEMDILEVRINSRKFLFNLNY